MLADSASLHLCIDIVLFLLEFGKNPLMTVNKVRHSPFSYQNICYASEGCYSSMLCITKPTFREKKNKGMCVNQLFSLTMDDVAQNYLEGEGTGEDIVQSGKLNS